VAQIEPPPAPPMPPPPPAPPAPPLLDSATEMKAELPRSLARPAAQTMATNEATAVGGAIAAAPAAQPQAGDINTEKYADHEDNAVMRVAEQPVSTFSIDVDTGSYTNVRRMLNDGQLPPRDAVRAEEFINYFDYAYAPPTNRKTPFAVHTEVAPAPWNPKHQLMLVGIKGYEIAAAEIPAANIVFLIDSSGSMESPDKIGLLKQSFMAMVPKLRAQDRISIVVYAGSAGLVLPPTSGADHETILSAFDRLSAGGSTNGAAGIELAYQQAKRAYIEGGVNRVILATDGDFNVGTVDMEALKTLVAEQRRSGVSLTTLGFGQGNYNDELSEQLADIGNGNHAYIDTLNEGHKVLVEEMSSTLFTIAKDVKIQIEFNPAVVSEYRLIGYENRMLAREDFNNDAIDAGEIGAGHDVTAIYEVVLAGSDAESVDPLRYGANATVKHSARRARLRQVALQAAGCGDQHADRTPDQAQRDREGSQPASAIRGGGGGLRGPPARRRTSRPVRSCADRPTRERRAQRRPIRLSERVPATREPCANPVGRGRTGRGGGGVVSRNFMMERPMIGFRCWVALLLIAPVTLADSKPDVATIYGRIQFVTSFPDFKVKVVDSFADLHVQVGESFPDKPGRWQMVESFPDYKIQIVESFPDFTIKYVESFPGPR
jgi:Ca-activated chloride channel family protein